MSRKARFFRNATLLFALWCLLSGRDDILFIGIGLSASLGIAGLHSFQPGAPNSTIPFLRFMAYLPWLLYRITLSSLHTVYLILNPRLPIDPRLIRHRTGLSDPAAVALLAVSVTLTPGTVTVETHDDELVVHALDPFSAEDLTSHTLEKKIAWVFERRWEGS